MTELLLSELSPNSLSKTFSLCVYVCVYICVYVRGHINLAMLYVLQELNKAHNDHNVNYNMLKEKIIQTEWVMWNISVVWIAWIIKNKLIIHRV